MLLLPNELFDDGSIECKTFCVATSDDSYVCEYSSIKKYYAAHVPAILEAIKAGKSYIGIEHHDGYFEIQWD